MPEKIELRQERNCLLPPNSLMFAEIWRLFKTKNHLNPILGTLQSTHFRSGITSCNQNWLPRLVLDSVYANDDRFLMILQECYTYWLAPRSQSLLTQTSEWYQQLCCNAWNHNHYCKWDLFFKTFFLKPLLRVTEIICIGPNYWKC